MFDMLTVKSVLDGSLALKTVVVSAEELSLAIGNRKNGGFFFFIEETEKNEEEEETEPRERKKI